MNGSMYRTGVITWKGLWPVTKFWHRKKHAALPNSLFRCKKFGREYQHLVCSRGRRSKKAPDEKGWERVRITWTKRCHKTEQESACWTVPKRPPPKRSLGNNKASDEKSRQQPEDSENDCYMPCAHWGRRGAPHVSPQTTSKNLVIKMQ